MSLRKHWIFALLFILIFTAFLLRGIAVPDPDFGWHIRTGSYILQQGIPHTDPFSYSMPSYLFVDHEWLTNILWSQTLSHWGMFPLLISTTLLAVGSLLLQVLIGKTKATSILLFLAAGTLFEFVGVRLQITTWFFLSFLLCILFDQKLWRRWRFLLPLLFLLWANLHGGFGIGLGVLGIVLIGKSWEEKKLVKERMLVFGLCLLATLINPYGIRLWGEFWTQFTDTNLRWTIAEWYPAYYFTNIAFWIYFSLSVILVTRYRRHYIKTELALYLVLLAEGLLSMRNIPIWVISSFFLTARAVQLLQKDAAKYTLGKERFAIAYKGFFVIALGIFMPQVALFFYGTYGLHEDQHLYPTNAVAYLQDHKPVEQIFTQYDWGGYMDWQMPEKKVYIDGRMASWRWHANIKGESNYAFDEYRNVLIGKIPFTAFVQKYHISTMLIPTDQLIPPAMKIFGITIPKNSFLQKLFVSDFSFYKVVQEAKKQGWREIYQDDTSVIFEKPGTIHENNGS